MSFRRLFPLGWCYGLDADCVLFFLGRDEEGIRPAASGI